MTVLGLPCCMQPSSSCGEQGYSSFWCAGASLWWILLLLSVGSRHAGFSSSSSCMGFVVVALALCHVGSSQTRDQTHVPCIGRWIPNRRTTGKSSQMLLFLISSAPFPHVKSSFSKKKGNLFPKRLFTSSRILPEDLNIN